MSGSLRGDYDQFADVLYLSVGQNDRSWFDEDDSGLIWRYHAGSDHPFGVTVREFRDFWKPHTVDLVRKISLALRAPEPEVWAAVLGLTENNA